MSCNHKHHSSFSPLAATLALLASNFQTHVAFASVGAGAGLPYEDVFSKIVTSLTGPWAWTVAIVCVIIFAWKAVQHGGDLGGSTMAFLGPAFICTLLLGAKKLMSFFGQGAMLTTASSTQTTSFCHALDLGLAVLIASANVLFALFLWRVRQRRREQSDSQDRATES